MQTSPRLIFATLAGVAVLALGPARGQGRVNPSTMNAPWAGVPSSVTSVEPFRTGVDLVSLDVCVKDRSGRFIHALAPEDFIVLEHGTPQRISFVWSAEALPLSAILLIDRSGSMSGTKIEQAMAAATAFAGTLDREDQIEVIAFDQRAERIFPFGSDLATLGPALSALQPAGQTALFDALLVATDELARARRTRTREFRDVILVLSDGRDTSSVLAFEEILTPLRRSGAVVYAVSLRAGPRGQWLGPTWELMQLAHDTGGRAIGVTRIDGLPTLYREIGEEIRHLYRLGYVSADPRRDGTWRPVSVRVLGGDVQARTRAGYYAPRGGS